jgi:hypothetical protein
MALFIPALASPTKANQKMILDGSNGIICRTDEEWMHNILKLAKSIPPREKWGSWEMKPLRKILANKVGRLFT